MQSLEEKKLGMVGIKDIDMKKAAPCYLEQPKNPELKETLQISPGFTSEGTEGQRRQATCCRSQWEFVTEPRLEARALASLFKVLSM